MKKLTYILSAVIALGFTSCLDDENHSDGTFGAWGYFTIGAKDETGIYSLYSDIGSIVRPTIESVNALTDGKGFGERERAYLAFKYRPEEIQKLEGNADFKEIVNNATLLDGQYLPMAKLLSVEAAAEAKITDKDSLYTINSFAGAWICNGYLNVSVVAAHADTYPTTNLVINEEATNLDNKELFLNLCFNRHKSITYGQDVFLTSFPLYDLPYENDSIKVVITAGDKDFKIKAGRNDLLRKTYNQ